MWIKVKEEVMEEVGSGFCLEWENEWSIESQEYESKEMCRSVQECMVE